MSDEVIAVRLPRPWSRELARIAVRSACTREDVVLHAIEALLNNCSTVQPSYEEITDE